jgi:hypothetical protein
VVGGEAGRQLREQVDDLQHGADDDQLERTQADGVDLVDQVVRERAAAGERAEAAQQEISRVRAHAGVLCGRTSPRAR